MLKTKKKLLLFLLVTVLIITGVIAYVIYWAFFSLDRLPEGEFVTKEVSPEETYTINAYITNGGATTPYAIRGELEWNNKNRKKTIYWEDKDSVDIEWQSEDEVIINGHSIKIPNGTYDFRRE
ncbi:DUF5412 family protein [Alteribacillus bidgolensis]|uniref:DUF5412 domain-containing protein n=1 Tax=Alteribacillus bidgolensis TaxID=930129 RepID=A0A1G8RD34_9BACI|nr:DUF5412 family protein [Alteribacillus bidgolensis]SDJ14868.1 hypothetical protein SAMN05216352_12628 [Alteribacillus bidgolensis]